MTAPARTTWFITGAASGFGRAFAAHALAQGYNVVATARDPAKLGDLAAQHPDRVLVYPLDVTRPEQASAAIAAAVARFGRIDVVINNAGYGVVGAVEETPEHELRALMDTNFFGAATVIQAALPTLRAQRAGASSTSQAWADSCRLRASARIRLRSSHWRVCPKRSHRESLPSASRC